MENNMAGFLAATALLAAVLLVWARLWVNVYKLYKDKLFRDKEELTETDFESLESDIESGVSVGLSWTFMAIGFSVAALACFACFEFLSDMAWVKQVGLGFFTAALFMTAIHIIQSFLSAVSKFWKGEAFDEPYDRPLNRCLTKWLIVCVPAGFLGFSLGATLDDNSWLLLGNPAIILVAGLIVVFTKICSKKDE